ncbi:MAG TPA: helicase HerA-like domain-containing protein, partial [Gaiellaceae bacterium]|nr:helicase HerA-like domain-containing protein [Gaiellaceae bacterium]
SLGTGEAAVTILSESGAPTPVVHTKLRGPLARMEPADDVDGVAKASPLYAKYGTRIDRESARERLAARIEAQPEPEPVAAPASRRRRAEPAQSGDPLTDFLGSRRGKAIQREVIRGMFGLLRKRL